ncbi:MAG: hypothetical protein IPG93_17050 [Burkholderiales bacterium]|nr:hypothetical protein [Burkholderiales bacterium]
MDVPVTLGIVVTFVASSAATFGSDGPFGAEVYFDSMTMFVSFLLAARWLESRARQRAAQSLDAGCGACSTRWSGSGRQWPGRVGHAGGAGHW